MKLHRISVSFIKGSQYFWIDESTEFSEVHHYFSAYGEYYSADDEKLHPNLKTRYLINMNNVQNIESYLTEPAIEIE